MGKILHENEFQTHSLHDSVVLSEADLELINALQVSPRASWQSLSAVFHVAPSTLSRRWQTLVDAGLAWVTTAPGEHHLDNGFTAFLLLSVQSGRIPAAVEQLMLEPMFGTISRIAGTYDLLVDCLAPSMDDLTELLSRSGGYADEISRREVMIPTRLYREATGWRAGAIEPSKVRLLRETNRADGASVSPGDYDAEIIESLGNDGRMSWSELAERCGAAPATIRRRTEQLLANGVFALRCDAASPIRQGRHGLTLLIDVPAPDLGSVAQWVGSRQDCRVCAEVIGSANLLVTLWVQRLADIWEFEQSLNQRSPGARVVARQKELATVKRLGMVLDGAGRRRRHVPLKFVQGHPSA